MKDLKENGITLVALAVTITVMLILGTISINAMFGENGVLKKAKEQGSKTKGTISESEIKTNQLMQEYENMMAGGVGNEVDEASQEIIDNLKQQIEEVQKQNEELKKGQATGNATEDQVLSGATFSTSKGVNLTGTMPSYTSGSQAVTTSGKWGIDTKYGAWTYIPRSGYYSTGHWLNIPWATIKGSLGTATTGNVLSGTTFTSTNGIKLTGTMANRGQAQYGSMGEGSDYYAINSLPEGAYFSNGASWAPEARIKKTTLLNYLGGDKAAYTGALSIGNDGSTLYFRIPRGVYKTNTSSGYPEITASISNINNATGIKGTTGTFYIGSTGNSSSTSVNCGFQPNIILAQDQNGTGRGFIYSTYSGLNLWFDADSKMKFENRISTTSTGFNVNGELAYGENRTYKYTAIKWY